MNPWDVTGTGQWALAGSRLSSKAQLGEKSVSQQMAWLEARRLSLARVACHACLSSLTDANNSYLECRGLIGSLSIFNALILWSIKSGLTFEGRASRPSRKNNQDWQCNSKGSAVLTEPEVLKFLRGAKCWSLLKLMYFVYLLLH